MTTIRTRPTMKDVAGHAGVALKTVSRVVNGEPGVRPQMAERVRVAITELGYRRNDSARLLRKGQTSSVGLIMEDIGDPFYAALSRAVEDVARSYSTLLLTGSSDEDPARERELTLEFCARRVDGLIIIPASGDHTYLLPEIAAGTAVVFVDRPPGIIEADAVLTDNVRGAFDGVSHLLGKGHRRIGFLGDAPHIYTASRRYRGYLEAMTAAGQQIEDCWVALGRPEQATIAAALQGMLDRPAPVTALMCGNNRISALALRELQHLAAAPALVGFDDFEFADLLTPGITVVAQNTTALGRIAAEVLFRRLAGDRGPVQRIELPTRLIVRGSGERPPP
ncbi:MAG TPA: LacI family DNA-binding transcriptional regulator [Streptosporangiaceae bacterium]|jgi:LacI family transcriptional regulator|nr:LacI family DNA-binding transcriptional regulator [Streptosporangiaceae bacterium]